MNNRFYLIMVKAALLLILSFEAQAGYQLELDENHQKYLQLVKSHKTFKAIKYGDLALKAAKRELASSDIGLARMKHDLGRVKSRFVFYGSEDPLLASNYLLEEALTVYRQDKNQYFEDIREVLVVLGDVYIRMGNMKGGRKHSKSGLRYYAEAVSHSLERYDSDSIVMAKMQLDIGIRLAKFSRNPKHSRTYLELAHSTFRDKLGDQSKEFGRASSWLGDLASRNGFGKTAIKYYMMAAQADADDEPYSFQGKKYKFKRQKYDAMKELAQNYIWRNHGDKATPYLIKMGGLLPPEAVLEPILFHRERTYHPVTKESEGDVLFHLTIGKDGYVKEAIVNKRRGSDRYEVAAKRSVKKLRYIPALAAGEPVETAGKPFLYTFRRAKPKHDFNFSKKSGGP